jgi:hypothetical protein
MYELDFKVYEDDKKDLLEMSRNIEVLNKELLELKELVNKINTLTTDYSPDIRDLELELIAIKNQILKAEQYIEKSNEYQNTNRSSFISGGLGSLAGGTIGIMLIPFMGPTMPLMSSLVGGVTGVIYSLSCDMSRV